MSVAAIEHVYRYAGGSRVVDAAGGPGLQLATSGGRAEHPRFFAGWVGHAAAAARSLLVVARAARTRYHVPPAMLARILAAADPVVTADDRALRFESFSGDCGVYARLDLDHERLDGELVQEGTTNVDFNPPMREALSQVVAGGPLHLSIGDRDVVALTGSGAVVERRVPLPARWIKGFAEVGAAQAAMEQRLDLPGPAVRRLVRELPRSSPASSVVHVRRSGRDVRLSAVPGRDGVPLAGAQRLALLEPLVVDAARLRAFAGPTGASAWVLDLPGGRLTLALSPEVWRGFSGEGAVLRDAAAGGDDTATGHAGFDLAAGGPFARRLPFDLDALERLHPRLHEARRLLADDAVRIEATTNDGVEAYVRGGGAEYHVRLRADDARCTCPWYAKHRGDRGPCKHVLATELTLAERADR